MADTENKAAKHLARVYVRKGRLAYVTSDNCIYLYDQDQTDLTSLIKHCSENNLTLYDVANDKEIEVKKVKNATTVS